MSNLLNFPIKFQLFMSTKWSNVTSFKGVVVDYVCPIFGLLLYDICPISITSYIFIDKRVFWFQN